MLNVLYVSHLNDLSRGGQRSLLTLVEHLDRSVVQPYLVVNAEGELADVFRQLGAKVFVLPFPSLSPKRIVSVIRAIRRLRQIIRENNIDLVHSDHERATLYCGYAARRTSASVIWHVRVVEAHHLDKAVVAKTDHIIGISDGVFARFDSKIDRRKCHKVFNGVDRNVFKPAEDVKSLRATLDLPPERMIFAFVGQINERKGVLDLLKAWKLLAQANCNPMPLLLIIGRRQAGGAWEPEYERLLASGELDGHVRELPQQANIQDWFAAVDVTILPSHEGVEGMGRVLFEAMACGTVAIGSDISGVRDAITPDSGVLFPQKSPSAIADAVTELLNNSAEYARLSQGGFERARTVFDVNIHARNVQDVYAAIQAEKNGS